MGKTLSEEKKEISVAEIVHHGEKLILPDQMTISNAIDLLHRRMQYEEEEVEFTETFDAFPWDGAAAMMRALEAQYGWAPAKAQYGMFGEKIRPKMITVDCDYDKQISVPWGSFNLPNVHGVVNCGYSNKDGRIMFTLQAQVLRRDERVVRDLFDRVKHELQKSSLYRGKAIKIRFRDEDGDKIPLPTPKFMNTAIDPAQLVYSRDVEHAIETNLFTPIRRVPDCVANGIPVKRGVLLGGPYGTGKTLAAKLAAKYAVDSGVTYIYVPRADELADAVEFGKQYGDPACVIFCEDVDRVMSGERDVAMDDILNIIDGIDTKSSNIIVVLTTNFLDTINPAMLRPGRLDAVVEVSPPDAEAVERLIRVYGGDAIDPDADLKKVGQVMDGVIPAVVEEMVKRAKLAQLRRQAPGEKVEMIGEDALLESAKTMQRQMDLLNRTTSEQPITLDQVLEKVVDRAFNGSKEKISDIHSRVC